MVMKRWYLTVCVESRCIMSLYENTSTTTRSSWDQKIAALSVGLFYRRKSSNDSLTPKWLTVRRFFHIFFDASKITWALKDRGCEPRRLWVYFNALLSFQRKHKHVENWGKTYWMLLKRWYLAVSLDNRRLFFYHELTNITTRIFKICTTKAFRSSLLIPSNPARSF